MAKDDDELTPMEAGRKLHKLARAYQDRNPDADYVTALQKICTDPNNYTVVMAYSRRIGDD